MNIDINKILDNNGSIPRKCWSKLSDYELDLLIDDIFNYYRGIGFPFFSTDSAFRNLEFNKFIKYDYTRCIDISSKTINQSMHGLALAWSYMPHNFLVSCNNLMSPFDAFSDDIIFRNVIKKRLKIGSNISHNGIRKMLKIFTGVQSVSNFRPTASSAIYSLYTKKGDVVYDMSAGYGGRLLGSYNSLIKYIGCEPCKLTYDALNSMISDFNINASIINDGSENVKLDKNSIDLCFTSPPYYNTEKYSNEDSQSYIKYPTKDEWINGYLYNTFKNSYDMLKYGKYMIINIANVKSFNNLETECIKVANTVGFVLDDVWRYALSNLSPTGTYKYEPLYIFKK